MEPELIISSIAIIVATVGVSLSAKYMINSNKITRESLENSKRLTEAQLFRDTDEDFKKILDKGVDLKSTEEVKRFVTDYENMCERIAFLNFEGNLPDKIAYHYRNYLAYGLTLEQWCLKHNFTPHLEYADKWCDKNDLKTSSRK